MSGDDTRRQRAVAAVTRDSPDQIRLTRQLRGATQGGIRAAGDYCWTSSTRRFFARPSSVSFGARGATGPVPTAFNRVAGMLCLVVSFFARQQNEEPQAGAMAPMILARAVMIV